MIIGNMKGKLWQFVPCSDLENVISFPIAETSYVFYKQKLNTYNLIAYFCSKHTK